MLYWIVDIVTARDLGAMGRFAMVMAALVGVALLGWFVTLAK
jgi:hypothetical protein